MGFLTFVPPFLLGEDVDLLPQIFTVRYTEVLWLFVCVYHWFIVLALKTSDINYMILSWVLHHEQRCRQFLSYFYSAWLSIRSISLCQSFRMN